MTNSVIENNSRAQIALEDRERGSYPRTGNVSITNNTIASSVPGSRLISHRWISRPDYIALLTSPTVVIDHNVYDLENGLLGFESFTANQNLYWASFADWQADTGQDANSTFGQLNNGLLREWWTGIPGSSVASLTSHPNYPENPTGYDMITSFEAPTNWANQYGTRVRGYIHPPVTGNYTFWIASDDNGELWLSNSALPNGASLIASVPSYTSSRQWDRFPGQRSATIHLQAGQRYYIEALQKDNWGGDNLAVAWEGPGISRQVIPGTHLSPWVFAEGPEAALLMNFDDAIGATNLIDSAGNFTGARSLVSGASPFTGVSGPGGMGRAATIKTASQRPQLVGLTSVETDLFNTRDFTVETVVRFDSNATGDVFQIREFSGPQSMMRFWVRDRTDTIGQQHEFGFSFRDSSGTVRNYSRWIRNALTPGTWHHLAMTYDSNTAANNDSILRIYLTPIGSAQTSLLHAFTNVADIRALGNQNTNLYLGGSATTTQFLNSDMAMFGYWNAVIAADDF